jgi:hypothetical protein
MTRLERPVRVKHSNLLRAFVNYGCKKFDNIDTWRFMTLIKRWIDRVARVQIETVPGRSSKTHLSGMFVIR